MPYLSIVINVDTRPERNASEKMFNGVVDRDFLTDGVFNKIKFFDGFDKEVILYCDEHEPIDEKTLDYMRSMADTLIIRKHNKSFEDNPDYAGFNDMNYIQALAQARGKYVFHFDGDIAAFTSSMQPIHELIDLLETYDYVSYPSHWSPLPVIDNSFDHTWVSTRFFCCKRSTLDIGEILKCQLDYDYLFETYPAARKCHWVEHILGLIAKYKGNGVYYPKMEIDKWALCTWGSYEKYTLRRLNEMPYEGIIDFVKNHPIVYPNDIFL